MRDTLSFDLLETAIILLDQDNKISDLNQSARRLFGYSNQHITQENFFNFIENDFDQIAIQQFNRQKHSIFLEEVMLKTAKGTINVNFMLSNIEQDHQNYRLLEIQSSDHHSHIRKDIALQQQSRVSTKLIRNLAHEIKNPLGGIKGAAQLLERKLPAGFSHKYSQIIIQETDRLSDLVSKMLLPAEPENKKIINPHKLLEQALDIVILQLEKLPKIIKDYDPSLPNIFVSAGQIQQALLNLIKNAIEAIDHNGKIILRTRVIHQHTIGSIQYRQVVRIDIIDNGVGIPDSIIKDIFYPTISGKNSSGLGLSIAQSLAQQHHGIIEVGKTEIYEQKDMTCFSLYLPVENER